MQKESRTWLSIAQTSSAPMSACSLAVSLVGVGGGGRRRCPEKVPEIFMFITPGTHTNLEKGLKTFYGAKAIGILLLGMSLTAEKMLSLQ